MYLLGWLPISLVHTVQIQMSSYLVFAKVVLQDSAMVNTDKQHSIDTDHSRLNKCAGLEDPLYMKLKKVIDRLRAPSPLEQANTHSQDKYQEKG